MARDDTAREPDTEPSPLDRRSHLQLAGATAAPFAATTIGGASRDTIEVTAGEKRTLTVGDGETSNKRTDITVDGTAEGPTTADADADRFSGSITDFRLEGGAVAEGNDGE